MHFIFSDRNTFFFLIIKQQYKFSLLLLFFMLRIWFFFSFPLLGYSRCVNPPISIAITALLLWQTTISIKLPSLQLRIFITLLFAGDFFICNPSTPSRPSCLPRLTCPPHPRLFPLLLMTFLGPQSLVRHFLWASTTTFLHLHMTLPPSPLGCNTCCCPLLLLPHFIPFPSFPLSTLRFTPLHSHLSLHLHNTFPPVHFSTFSVE